MPECEHCGHRTEAKVNFCVKCGTPSTPQSEPNTEPALPEPDPEDTHQTDTNTNDDVSVGVPQIVPFVAEICNPLGSEGLIDHDTAASPTV